MNVKDVMTTLPYCCKPTDTVQEAALLMKAHDVGAIPVVNDCDEKKLLGIITDRDICLRIAAEGEASGKVKVSEVMTRSVETCQAEDLIESCEAKMAMRQVRRMPVVDKQGICVGIVSQADVALRDTAEHTSYMIAAISRHPAASRKPSSHVAPAGAA
ncbi:CBS domain-containing protein [Acidipila rosea]|uniref:CBS domain protein n=1 Tax=Acidipila rosea TaxID=768535 RepID=A0A4R1L5Y8_9BACT|nr:CBS domain-containing protein [Acidipila rosea]TCK73555.1 CBS domain protein [Acidipila rosea]